jgi:FAD/FMN-containing dehydrogenase
MKFCVSRFFCGVLTCFRSQTAWQSPTCVAFPDTKEDVSLTIKTVKFFSTRFSVRSGGHSPNPGHSTFEGLGLLIDLQRLNQIDVSSDAKTVALGPGARWGSVLSTLDGYNVSVIGARIPHVGVGGAFLGGRILVSPGYAFALLLFLGGYFHFSGQYGMAADNLKNIEVRMHCPSVYVIPSILHIQRLCSGMAQ